MKLEGFRTDKNVDLTLEYRAEGINAIMTTIVPNHIFMEILQLAERKRHHLVKTYYSRWRNFNDPEKNRKSHVSRVKYGRWVIMRYKHDTQVQFRKIS